MYNILRSQTWHSLINYLQQQYNVIFLSLPTQASLFVLFLSKNRMYIHLFIFFLLSKLHHQRLDNNTQRACSSYIWKNSSAGRNHQITGVGLSHFTFRPFSDSEQPQIMAQWNVYGMLWQSQLPYNFAPLQMKRRFTRIFSFALKTNILWICESG